MQYNGIMFRLFRKKEKLLGDVVDLIEDYRTVPSRSNDYVSSVYFTIYRHGTTERIGKIDLRIGMNRELYYAGNIGYRVDLGYRGHGYAYDASRVLFPAARDIFGMKELIITCSPDNLPSRRTLEKLGGILLGTKDVPEDHWLYQRGEPVKNIYLYQL